MGSFLGHVLPGSLFIAFAVWWTILITRRWIVCSRIGAPFVNTASYHCWGVTSRISMEGFFKILVTSVGIIGELIAATEPLRENSVGLRGDLNGVYVGDIQHVSMYMFFLLSGIVDCLIHNQCIKLPFSLDYIVSALAFSAEFILFYFHVSAGQDLLERCLHTLLLWAIFACVCTVLLEMNFRQSLLCGYARAFAVFLQGTWFYQVAFILYPVLPTQRHWESNDANVMYAALFFTWHWILVAFLMLSIVVMTSSASSMCHGVRENSVEVIKIRELSVGVVKTRYYPINQVDSESEDETVFVADIDT